VHLIQFKCRGGFDEMVTQFRGRTWVCTHLFRGNLHSCMGELFVSPEGALCFALLPMVSRPLSFPRGVGVVSVLSQLCWSVALTLGDRDFLLEVILFLAFDHLLRLFVCFSYFSFFSELVMLCVAKFTHQGEDWGPRVSEDQWMIAP
jgi:hypothetical protein